MLLLTTSACASATPPRREVPASPERSAPLVDVSIASRHQRTILLSDRVPGFDRLSFSEPTAALYDPERDVYWISNANGAGADDNGFVSRLDPEGEVMILNYIDGARPNVTLHSPAGLALAGDRLLVADVGGVREFDADSGKPLGVIALPSAVHPSDVAVGADGSLYIADLGADPDLAGSDPRGKDAVYRVTPAGDVLTLVKTPSLRGPSALHADASGLWLVDVGAGALARLFKGETPDTPIAEAAERQPLGLGVLSGLTRLPDETFLVSARDRGAVFRGTPGGAFERVVEGLEGPADLGYDVKRQRLIVPLFSGHALAVFDLPPFRDARSELRAPALEPPAAPAVEPPALEEDAANRREKPARDEARPVRAEARVLDIPARPAHTGAPLALSRADGVSAPAPSPGPGSVP